MKRLLFPLLLLAALPAQADTNSDEPSAQDQAELLRLVRPYLYEMNQPVTTYHWEERAKNNLPEDPKDSSAVKELKDKTAGYWNGDYNSGGFSYSPGSNFVSMSMSGYRADAFPTTGLAAHQNPTPNTKTAVTVVQIPPGFRVLDLDRDGGLMLPEAQTGLIDRLGCPPSWKQQGFLAGLADPTSLTSLPKCQKAVQKLLKDQLKIDGFILPVYQNQQTANCESDTPNPDLGTYVLPHTQQFLITNPAKIRTDDLRIYDETSKTDLSARQRIQSLISNSFAIPPSDNSTPPPGVMATALKKKGMDRYIPWLKNMISSYSSSFNGAPPTVTVICCESPTSISYMPDAAISSPAPQPAPQGGKTPGKIDVSTMTVKLTTAAALATTTPHYTRDGSGATPRANPGPLTPRRNPNYKPQANGIKASPAINHCITINFRGDALSKMTSSPNLNAGDVDAGYFLWKDLDGKEKSSGLKDWERSHEYGCLLKNYYHQVSPTYSNASQSLDSGAGQSGGADAK